MCRRESMPFARLVIAPCHYKAQRPVAIHAFLLAVSLRETKKALILTTVLNPCLFARRVIARARGPWQSMPFCSPCHCEGRRPVAIHPFCLCFLKSKSSKKSWIATGGTKMPPYNDKVGSGLPRHSLALIPRNDRVGECLRSFLAITSLGAMA